MSQGFFAIIDRGESAIVHVIEVLYGINATVKVYNKYNSEADRLSQGYYAIIDHGESATVHVIEVLYGINATVKRFIFQLMETVQLSVSKGYDLQMVINSANSTSDVSLSREQKN